VIALCFIIGMLGAAIALYQLGMFGTTDRKGSLDAAVAHADEAVKHGRWDQPPGDNVRDLTNDALARWPREPRLLELRGRATDELVKEAVGRKFAGDLPAALHLAKLAAELDPSDTTAQHLVEEYERDARKATAEPSSSPPKPTPQGAMPPRASTARLPPLPAGTSRVVLEPSVPRPKVGQSVTFTARVAAPPAAGHGLDDPRFVINGPGLATDTKLGAIPGAGGAYAATFTGFEPGKYEVTFDARLDGAPVRASRVVTLDADPSGPGATQTLPGVPVAPSASPGTPPIPSGKWL
jgi:hypothetical protein